MPQGKACVCVCEEDGWGECGPECDAERAARRTICQLLGHLAVVLHLACGRRLLPCRLRRALALLLLVLLTRGLRYQIVPRRLRLGHRLAEPLLGRRLRLAGQPLHVCKKATGSALARTATRRRCRRVAAAAAVGIAIGRTPASAAATERAYDAGMPGGTRQVSGAEPALIPLRGVCPRPQQLSDHLRIRRRTGRTSASSAHAAIAHGQAGRARVWAGGRACAGGQNRSGDESTWAYACIHQGTEAGTRRAHLVMALRRSDHHGR